MVKLEDIEKVPHPLGAEVGYQYKPKTNEEWEVVLNHLVKEAERMVPAAARPIRKHVRTFLGYLRRGEVTFIYHSGKEIPTNFSPLIVEDI